MSDTDAQQLAALGEKAVESLTDYQKAVIKRSIVAVLTEIAPELGLVTEEVLDLLATPGVQELIERKIREISQSKVDISASVVEFADHRKGG